MLISTLTLTLQVKLDTATSYIINEAVNDALASRDRVHTEYIPLAAGATEVQVQFGTLTTAKTLLIVSDHEIAAKLNDALPSFTFSFLCIDSSNITKLVLSNPGLNQATVRIYLLGS